MKPLMKLEAAILFFTDWHCRTMLKPLCLSILNLSVFFKVHKNEIRFIWRVGFGALKLNRQTKKLRTCREKTGNLRAERFALASAINKADRALVTLAKCFERLLASHLLLLRIHTTRYGSILHICFSLWRRPEADDTLKKTSSRFIPLTRFTRIERL